MPETVTILEATAEANHHMAVQKATNIWKEKAKLLIPEKPGYLSEKSFRNVLELFFLSRYHAVRSGGSWFPASDLELYEK